MTPYLPVEILIDIMHLVGDWKLATAVGMPTLLPQPSDWGWATQTDRAVITGHLPTIWKASPSTDNKLTQVGAQLIIRFGYVNVLEYFFSQNPKIFLGAFACDMIPINMEHRTVKLVFGTGKPDHQCRRVLPLPGTSDTVLCTFAR